MTHPAFATFTKYDDTLASYGIPACSEWWRETLARLYDGQHTRLTACVGRGGAKSHTATKAAVFEVLHGTWTVPPGECHYYALVSISKDEAAERRRLIRQILDALGVPYDSNGDVITLRDRPLGWRVFANDGAAVRGFRCVGFTCDELAFWPYETDAADPAGDVIASLEAMTITHAQAKSFFISSPWGLDNEFQRMHDLGDTTTQVTARASSWEANPAVNTREGCLEKSHGDMRRFRRDYEAIPAATESAALDPEHLAAAFERTARGGFGGEAVLGVDPSNLNRDAFAWSVFQCDARGVLCLRHIGQALPADHLTTAGVVERVGEDARAFNAFVAYADAYQGAPLAEAFLRGGMNLRQRAWTVQSKMRAVEVIAQLLRDGRLSLPNDPELRAELFSLQGRLSPNGTISYATNGKDLACTLLAIAHAISDGLFQVPDVNDGGALPPANVMTAAMGVLLQFGHTSRPTDIIGQMAYDKMMAEYEQDVAMDQHQRDEQIERERKIEHENPTCVCAHKRSEHSDTPPHAMTAVYDRKACPGFVKCPYRPAAE
jgi:hypothetical protein